MKSEEILFDYNRNPFEKHPILEFERKLPQKTSREINNTLMGLGFETLDRETFNPKDFYDLVGESGVKSVRCQTGWIRCERVRGEYDFSWLDDVVDSLSQRGIRTWFSLGYGNPLYTPVPKYEEIRRESGGKILSGRVRGYVGEVPLYHGEEAMRGFLNYVRALAGHFKDRVTEWEIWNEPDIPGHFWNYQGSAPYPELTVSERLKRCAADYVLFFRETGRAIRSVIPSARLAACAANPASEYIRFCAESGLSDLADIFCYHLYGNQENYTGRRVRFAKACLGPKLEYWQGESGFPTGKSTLHTLPTEYNQAKFVARRAMIDLQCGAKRSSIFTVTDFLNYYPDGSNQYYGIIHGATREPKLSYHVLKAMAFLTENAVPAEDLLIRFTPTHGSVLAPIRPYDLETVTFRKNGIPAAALWQPENVAISFQPLTGEIQFLTGRTSPFPDPVLIDPLRGNVYRILNTECPAWAMGAMVLPPIPIPDYPVLITDLRAITT